MKITDAAPSTNGATSTTTLATIPDQAKYQSSDAVNQKTLDHQPGKNEQSAFKHRAALND